MYIPKYAYDINVDIIRMVIPIQFYTYLITSKRFLNLNELCF